MRQSLISNYLLGFFALFVLFTSFLLGQGKVCLALGSDMPIWDDMDTGRIHFRYGVVAEVEY